MKTDDKKRNDLENRFSEFLSNRGLRHTRERTAVVGAIATLGRRFTVERLHGAIVESGFRLSLATVYNCVELIVEAGLLTSHYHDRDHVTLYEVATDSTPALRLVCRDCGSVKTLRNDEVASQLARRRFGSFHPDYFDLNIVGICLKCQRRRKRQKRLEQNDSKQ